MSNYPDLSKFSKQYTLGLKQPKQVPNYAPPKPGQKTCPNCQELLPIDRKCGCESYEFISPIQNPTLDKENQNPINTLSNHCLVFLY